MNYLLRLVRNTLICFVLIYVLHFIGLPMLWVIKAANPALALFVANMILAFLFAAIGTKAVLA